MAVITDRDGNVLREVEDTLADWRQAATVEAKLRREFQEKAEELEALFDLRWKADQRAIKRWREMGPPDRTLRQPDHADMVVWLLEQLDAANAEIAELKP